MAASSTLVSSLQKDLEDACSSIVSIVASASSSSSTHAALALQRNRDLNSLLQRLISLHSQLSSIVSAFCLIDDDANPVSRMSSKTWVTARAKWWMPGSSLAIAYLRKWFHAIASFFYFQRFSLISSCLAQLSQAEQRLSLQVSAAKQILKRRSTGRYGEVQFLWLYS